MSNQRYTPEFKDEAARQIVDRGYSVADVSKRLDVSAHSLYKWSKDFMEAGKKRLAGDIVRQANTSEVSDLRREARDLKEVVAEQTLELRLLKKSMLGDGDDLE